MPLTVDTVKGRELTVNPMASHELHEEGYVELWRAEDDIYGLWWAKNGDGRWEVFAYRRSFAGWSLDMPYVGITGDLEFCRSQTVPPYAIAEGKAVRVL